MLLISSVFLYHDLINISYCKFMVVCCGIVGRGACTQSLLVSVLLLVLVFPFLSSREFSGLTPQSPRVTGNPTNAMVCDTPYLQNEFGDPRFFLRF